MEFRCKAVFRCVGILWASYSVLISIASKQAYASSLQLVSTHIRHLSNGTIIVNTRKVSNIQKV
jgi:hypothetical protein